MNPNSPKTYDDLPLIFRGGCWCSTVPSWVHAAARYPVEPSGRVSNIGFRTRLTGRMPRV